jgi:hypothetical protein
MLKEAVESLTSAGARSRSRLENNECSNDSTIIPAKD